MIYSDFQGKQLSLLGFGTMRLPTLPDGTIDEAQTRIMVRDAFDRGVNYFDTAYPYHGGMSERVIGKILKDYPRDSFFLATKFPGHQISSSYNPAAIFEEQLEKCQMDYFDFYLLHNVYEKSIETYLDPRWGILDYFREQKKQGRIRHLGFSSHGRVELLDRFLDVCGDDMEFCQIQLNYLDWTLQQAKEKYELLTRRNIPVWVMEPVRGGKLANLPADAEEKRKAMDPDHSAASWGFRFLQGLPNVKMVLSGMSNPDQMRDNLATFETRCPLTKEEEALAFSIADHMKNAVPCTGCRYCCDGCPMGLNIPVLISVYNDLKFQPTTNAAMMTEFLPEDKKPSACVACGKCTKICPQGIEVPRIMKELTELLKTVPSWVEVSRQREEEAIRSRKQAK